MKSRYLTIIAVALGLCSVSSSWALELNLGGDFTKIPTHGRGEMPLLKGEKAIQVRIRSQVYGTRLSGDVSRSFKDEATHYGNVLTLGYDHPFKDRTRTLRLRADLRNTDDPWRQKKRLELCGLLFTFGKEKRYRFQAGDIAVHGGRYTFQRSMEGASYRHNLSIAGGELEAQAGYGRLQEAKEGIGFRRLLLASGLAWEGRVNRFLVEQLKLNLAYARTWDDEESISQKGELTPDQNGVIGIGIHLRLKNNLNLKGELASSSFKDAPSKDPSKDNAFCLEVDKRFGLGNLRVGWEEIQPDFRSLSGSGYPDTRRLSGYFNTSIGRRITLSTGINRNRDNLNGKKGFTTTGTSPNIYLSVRPFGDRTEHLILQRLRFSPSMYWSFHKTSDGSMQRHILNQNYRLSTGIRDWRVSVAYHNQGTEDKVTPDNDRQGDGWRVVLSHPTIIAYKWATGGITFSSNRSSDGLKKDPKNKRTIWRLRSSGAIFQISYAWSFGFQKADFASGINDYERTTWAFSLSRTVERFQNLAVGITLDGSHNKDEDPSKTFKELTSRFQIQTSL